MLAQRHCFADGAVGVGARVGAALGCRFSIVSTRDRPFTATNLPLDAEWMGADTSSASARRKDYKKTVMLATRAHGVTDNEDIKAVSAWCVSVSKSPHRAMRSVLRPLCPVFKVLRSAASDT